MAARLGKAVVAMSGGVDSSVAAALMAEAGWQAVGVTLKLLGRAETGFGCCGSPADIEDARRVCGTLGIPHYTLELSDLFEDKVVRPFVEAYLAAETPNPCVECNRSVKFGYLLALAEAWGAEALATGHYARVEAGRLLAARDLAKDQSYFLHALGPRELARVRFPVGALTKEEVRAKARALGLSTADKPESQEICFVPARDYRAFLAARPEAAAGTAALAEGPIADRAGRVLGRHAGLASYTVGQRKGLGLGGGQARFVVALDAASNTLVVGGEAETRRAAFEVRAVSWTAGAAPSGPFRAAVRIRHRHAPAAAALEPRADGAVSVLFDEPQRAVTPGQAAVFYREQEVLGGGVIAPLEAP